ncbi:hypothetical protein GCM10023156_29370 [Novipirellula rosea]|uniref:Uncharacterized protein n=1 Tax=Novipirellula rosea TaxID=1031540 RepID=A0ABP8MVF1_9BACT
MFIILGGFETEQRKFKTVLSTAGLGVADAGVAACFGQDGSDVVGEANRMYAGVRERGVGKGDITEAQR